MSLIENPVPPVNEDRFLRADLLFAAPNCFQRHTIDGSQWIACQVDGNTVGYACIGSKSWYKNALLEFHLVPASYHLADALFDKLHSQYSFTQMFFSTLDILLLSLTLNRNYPFKSTGYLFRHDAHDSHKSSSINGDLSINPAQPEDLQRIYERLVKPSSRDFALLYRGKEKTLLENITRKEIHIARLKNDDVGLGFKVPLPFLKTYSDIGMLVFPDCRGKGIGTYIVKELLGLCHEDGSIPVATCSAENEASRMTLARCGFHPIARILKATVETP